MLSKENIAAKYQDVQSLICKAIESADGNGKFISDKWEREGGGGGLTRVMTNGKILEKAGVNFSAVHGELNDEMLRNLKVNDAKEFFATGVSIVMHPHNPHVPIIHMNIRYFEMDNGQYWFGGGIDLTPHYINTREAEYFHRELKSVCDKYHNSFYPRFKKWADDYFFIPHRNETRGIGGVFYDHLIATDDLSKEDIFNFSVDLGMLFPQIYSKLMTQNAQKHFTPLEKEWQFVRRGRYVEFNLVYDRGTRFGLYSNGRTESILMSLPQEAKWFYNYQTQPDSPEEKTLSLLKKDVDWINAKHR